MNINNTVTVSTDRRKFPPPIEGTSSEIGIVTYLHNYIFTFLSNKRIEVVIWSGIKALVI